MLELDGLMPMINEAGTRPWEKLEYNLNLLELNEVLERKKQHSDFGCQNRYVVDIAVARS
jgi:hypothetical protein